MEDGESGLGYEEFEKLGCPISSKSEVAKQKRARNIYMEVLRSYDELQDRAMSLEDAKRKILGYYTDARISFFFTSL